MKNKNLAVMAYANGITFWVYCDKTISIDEMEKPNFFESVKDLMAIGDAMWLVASDTVKQLWVKTLTPEVTLEELGE